MKDLCLIECAEGLLPPNTVGGLSVLVHCTKVINAKGNRLLVQGAKSLRVFSTNAEPIGLMQLDGICLFGLLTFYSSTRVLASVTRSERNHREVLLTYGC